MSETDWLENIFKWNIYLQEIKEGTTTTTIITF